MRHDRIHQIPGASAFRIRSRAFKTSEKVPSPFFEMSLSKLRTNLISGEHQVFSQVFTFIVWSSVEMCGDVWKRMGNEWETNGKRMGKKVDEFDDEDQKMDPVGWDWKLPIIFPESRRRKESNKTQRLQDLQNRQRPDLRPGLAACFLTFAGNVRRKH